MAQATVSWDSTGNRPRVNPDNIDVSVGNGAQVIRWDADSSIASFNILGLDGNGEFINQIQGPGGKWVTIVDKADRNGTWNYTVSAQPVAGGSVSIDPKITNGSA
ncbi:MAG: hypothetical protein EHM61_17335 [Acidobacteria bacterium]|nr:MAG: hypothetical protein EHM61_17335 [Acidobacteriota bacterium]